MYALYLTHPQVEIDPAIEVPQWKLSGVGRERAHDLSKRLRLPPKTRLIASTERKAMDLAQILSEDHGLDITSAVVFNENDRSATGFLPGDAFEIAANCFFGEPEKSHAGWERAIDAQCRIVAAVEGAIAATSRPLIFCGHGAVGTLLKCHIVGTAITREQDQGHGGDPGGGNGLVFDWAAQRLVCDWTPFEALDPDWLVRAIA
ncbi:histidine phosphatase family protein [Devosia algicola]|uniref:Histidine phosphatase family protein n=1 Tax=Devosia algicola TaxID=3026418 RepID=A0ABY7YKV1_9HYPH|nr:histidine phosphatase family protein [Devosia algicola]WDR01817.1 histidine phosphatase family protein [Devosia algicola]